MTHSPRIVLDFDGVLHAYTSGWTGPVPTDPPVPGARAAVEALIARGFGVVVQSTRARDVAGLAGMVSWLTAHGFPALDITAEKVPAQLYVDDRGFRFVGDWAALFAFLDATENRPGSWVK